MVLIFDIVADQDRHSLMENKQTNKQTNNGMSTVYKISLVLVNDHFLGGLEPFVCIQTIKWKCQHVEIKAHEWTLPEELDLKQLRGLQRQQHRLVHKVSFIPNIDIIKQHSYSTGTNAPTQNYVPTWYSCQCHQYKVLLGNTCGVILVNNFGFSHILPMKSKGQAGNELIGMVPRNLHSDIGVRIYLNMKV